MTMTVRAGACLIAATAVLLLAGCDYLPFGHTQVKDITAAPANFEGREVRLKGKVVSIVKLMGLKAYTLQDATGEISVLTEGELPHSGATVALRGTVKSAVIIGGQSLGLRVEESRRLPW
jgi:hypothetical protein